MKLEKVESGEVSSSIFADMPDNYLEALGRLSGSVTEDALKYYIGKRQVLLAKEMSKLAKTPREKGWDTLFQLQDLQSKLVEVVKLLKLFSDANRVLNAKREKKIDKAI